MKTINILGDIIQSEDYRWTDAEVSPANIIDALAAANGEPVEININSNGGSLTAGLAIANAIKAYKGGVTCNVLGVAASMASVIACAAPVLNMGQGAFLMVHNPWTRATGDADDHRKVADTLDQMRDAIVSFYMSKFSKSQDDLKALMDAETWIDAEHAADFGFSIGSCSSDLKVAAALTRDSFDSAPDAAKALLSFCDHKPDGAARPPQPTDWEARFKGASKKINELQTTIAANAADYKSLQSKLDETHSDLAAAQAKVSELEARIAESDKALQTATADLALTRDSLAKAEDTVKELTQARDMLTAGVLNVAPQSSYDERMAAAKSPAEREALRKQKAQGAIK